MKSIISIGLIVLGLIFECLHYLTDIRFFKIKLSILGVVCITLGVIGFLWYSMIPILEKRAKVLGTFKKERIKKSSNN